MSDKQQRDAETPDIMTLEDAERAYLEQWGALGEPALHSLRVFTCGDHAKFIRMVRRSLAAPRELFAAFFQSCMREAIAKGYLPPGGSEWDRQPSAKREAN